MPIEIQTRPVPSASPPRLQRLASLRLFARRASLGARERLFFTERLALLLETGIPLHTALDSLARQAGVEALRAMAEQLRDDVAGGRSFSQALAKHPEDFPRTYVSLVAAAEQGGFLPAALDRLRDLEERRAELRSALLAAVSYPAFLMVFSLAVVVFVLVVVFPKFEELFTLIRDQLPITTRWLMAASAALREGWLPGLGMLAALTALASHWLKRPEGVETLDRLALGTPGLRRIVIQLNLVQFLRVMSLSLTNGVSMIEALRASKETLSSSRFRRLVERIEARVNEGSGFATGFAGTEIVPSLAREMLETGEESGNLANVMGRLADFYEREWRKALALVSKIAEPAMLILMGGVVGLIVSSLILPIFKLSRAVH